MSPKFAGGVSQKSSYSKSGFGNNDDGSSTPDSSDSHMSFESDGEVHVHVNHKKVHVEVSSILMGFSKAKPKKEVRKDSVEFHFMGDIISEDDNEDDKSLPSIGDNHTAQSRSRTMLGTKYKSDAIYLADKDMKVPFEDKDSSVIEKSSEQRERDGLTPY